MAATKSAAAFTWASGSQYISGTTNSISTSTDYIQTVYGKLVQVGPATTAATVQVQDSPDGSTYYSPPAKLWVAPLAAGTYYFEVAVDPTAESTQVVYTAQSGGTSSALTMQLGQVTGI